MKKTSKYILMSALTALALGGVCYISTKDYSPIIGNEGKDNEQYILLHKTAQIGDSIDISGALTNKVSKPYLDYAANEDGTFNARFISGFSVDNYDNNATTIPYLNMGFNINYRYGATTHDFSSTVDRVFKSVIINNKTYNKENMSSLFNDGNSYDYLLVKSLLNIPSDGLNTILNVSPFIVDSSNQLYTSTNSLSNSIYGDLFDNNISSDNVKVEFEDFTLGGSAIAASKDTSEHKTTRHYLAKLGGRCAASPYEKEVTSPRGKLINPTGDFVLQFDNTSTMTYTYHSDAEGYADIIIRGASNKNKKNYSIEELKLANAFKLTINEEDFSVSSNASFLGQIDEVADETVNIVGKDTDGDGKDDVNLDLNGRYMMQLWQSVNIGKVHIVKGDNVFKFTANNGNASGHYDYMELDFGKYNNKNIIDESIKLEAEAFTLTKNKADDGISKAKDHDNWLYAYSSPAVATKWDENGLVTDNSRDGYYVGNVREGDKMAHSFVSSRDGYLNYSIAGSSNYVTKVSSSSQSVPSETGDMYLNKVMTVKVNGIPVSISQSATFNGGKDSDRGRTDGDRSLFTNYILNSLMRLNVREGQTYNIEYTFIHDANYIDAYGNEVCGNYDYVTLDYYHYAAN